ncbi:MAG: DinB family protein [Chloroflexota bacterium]
MKTAEIRTLFAYHAWANRRVYEAACTLSEKDYYAEIDYSTGSIHRHLFHIMFVDWSSLMVLTGDYPPQDDPRHLKEEKVRNRAALRRRWDELEIQLMDFVSRLTETQLSSPVRLIHTEDMMHGAYLWEMLVSLVNHGTNHRAQVLAMMYHLGHKVDVEQGLYFYLVERAVKARKAR